MMDYTRGGFGSINEDVLAQNYANIKEAVSFNRMLGDPYQYNNTSAVTDYHNPKNSMHEYGVTDYLSHNFIKKHRELGTNYNTESLASEEYKDIAKKVAGLDGLSTASSIVGMMTGNIVAGEVVSYGIDKYKEQYFKNMRFSQRINSMTGNIRDKDGSMGLKGKEVSSIAKFVRKSAAKDMLMDSDDYETMLGTASDSGMLNQVGTSQAFKKKVTELSKVVKDLGDAVNSGDIKGLIEEMARFSRIGVGDTGAMAHFSKREYESLSLQGLGRRQCSRGYLT
jgi:hypothetical protein